MTTEPQITTLTPQKERPETQFHTKTLMEKLSQLNSPEFGTQNLHGLFEAEAYMTADLALISRQEDKNQRLADFGDDLSMLWMEAANAAKKANEANLDKLTDDELSLLARAAAIMYGSYVLPKILTDNTLPENFGIVKVIREIYQHSEKLKPTERSLYLYRPAGITPMQIETDMFNTSLDPNPYLVQEPSIEETGKLFGLVGNDEGLALLAKTQDRNLQIAKGDSRGDNVHGWAIKLWMKDKGVLYERSQDARSGSFDSGNDLNTTKKFTWNESSNDFLSDDKQKLVKDRAAEHFPGYTRTAKNFVEGILQSITIRL